MKNKKIFIISGLVIIAGAAVFFLFRQSAADSLEGGDAGIKWEELMPEVENIIKQKFEQDGLRAPSIYKQVDITGDGLPEALVYTGSGGAYTDQLVLMTTKEGKPVLASFRDEQGEEVVPIFLSGSSVRRGETVEMMAQENLIYSISWGMNEDGEIEGCNVVVYQWNKNSGRFEYESFLSESSEAELCIPLTKK